MRITFTGFRVLAAAAALCLPVVLSGCIKGRPAAKQDLPAAFESPYPPAVRDGLTLTDIRAALSERGAVAKSVRAAMTLTVGAGKSKARQQFDASMFSETGGVLRIKGSADAGTLFDVLLDRNDAQVMIVPEHKYYRGSVSRLRMNGELLAGVQPEDLPLSILAEQNLYSRLKRSQPANLQETPDHYLVTFDFPSGVSERYQLRKADLLTDQLDRLQSGQVVSSVRYGGYQVYDGRTPLPTRFQAKLMSGTELTVQVTDIGLNEQRPASIAMMQVPDGFDRMAL